MKLRRPPRGEVWVHIDRFGNPDGRIWAVQFHRGRRHHYRLVKGVTLLVNTRTEDLGYKQGDVSAVIVAGNAEGFGPRANILVRFIDRGAWAIVEAA